MIIIQTLRLGTKTLLRKYCMINKPFKLENLSKRHEEILG